MGIENFESGKQAPEALLKYEKWWKDTYGRETTAKEDEELISLAKELAKNDPKFKEILAANLLTEFLDNKDNLKNDGFRRWTLVAALSTYGKEFGLQVD